LKAIKVISDRKIIQEMQSFTSGDLLRTLVVPRTGGRVLGDILLDSTISLELRDFSLWAMFQERPKNTAGVLHEVACEDSDPKMRKSASWALAKYGSIDLLVEAIAKESDENVGSWKRHLLLDLQDDTRPPDSRPIKFLPGKVFDITMPLQIEGFVEFKDAQGNWHTLATGPIANERMIGELTWRQRSDL
jgi:hypothetical protein